MTGVELIAAERQRQIETEGENEKHLYTYWKVFSTSRK